MVAPKVPRPSPTCSERSSWWTWPWPARHQCAASPAMRWTTSTTEQRSTSGCLQPGQLALGSALNRRPFEEIGIHQAVQGHRVGERQLAELPLVDQLMLDQLPGLLKHLGHVRHVEVRDVGAEHRLEPHAHRRALVERPAHRRVVGLAAEVELAAEYIADLLRCRDV